MNDTTPARHRNVLKVSVDRPLFLDEVVPHVYVGEFNDFIWEQFMPGLDPPAAASGAVTEERGGREVIVTVETLGEPLTRWAKVLAGAFPVLLVFLRVEGTVVMYWQGGKPALPPTP